MFGKYSVLLTYEISLYSNKNGRQNHNCFPRVTRYMLINVFSIRTSQITYTIVSLMKSLFAITNAQH